MIQHLSFIKSVKKKNKKKKKAFVFFFYVGLLYMVVIKQKFCFHPQYYFGELFGARLFSFWNIVVTMTGMLLFLLWSVFLISKNQIPCVARLGRLNANAQKPCVLWWLDKQHHLSADSSLIINLSFLRTLGFFVY